MEDRFGEILTEKALDFVAGLHSQFAGRRADLLAIRRGRNDQERPFVRNSRNALAPLRQDQQGLGSLHGHIDTEVLPCSVLVADEGCHFFRW